MRQGLRNSEEPVLSGRAIRLTFAHLENIGLCTLATAILSSMNRIYVRTFYHKKKNQAITHETTVVGGPIQETGTTSTSADRILSLMLQNGVSNKPCTKSLKQQDAFKITSSKSRLQQQGFEQAYHTVTQTHSAPFLQTVN